MKTLSCVFAREQGRRMSGRSIRLMVLWCVGLAGIAFGQTGDTVPPTATRFAIESSTVSTVTFRLDFNEPVRGVSPASFIINTSGAANATIARIVGAGPSTTFAIEVSYGGPVGGTISLTTRSSGSGITDVAGNAFAGTGAATSETFRIATGPSDATPPTIASFALASNDAANRTVSYQLVFDEAVRGVTAGSFTVNTSTGVTAQVTAVSPSTGPATTYTVTASYNTAAGGGAGTISLTARSAGSGITDLANNAYAGGGAATSASFTVPAAPGDSSAPSVTRFGLDGYTPRSGGGFARVTFNEAVTGVDQGDFDFVTTGSTTGAIRGLRPVTSSGGTVYEIDFTVTENPGSFAVRIRNSGTGIADASGNAFAGGGIASTAPFMITEGQTPMVQLFSVGASSDSTVNFNLAFTEPVTGVDSGDIAVTTSSGVTATIGTLTGSGASYAVPVNFTGSAGGTITLAVRDSGTGIQDSNGNLLASFGSTNASQTFTIPAGTTATPPTTPTTPTTPATPPTTPPTTPPNVPPNPVPPVVTPPPTIGMTEQRIDFTSPVSSFTINQPVSLSATSSAGLPITFSVVRGSALLNGSLLTPTGPGEVIVRASSTGNATVAPASVDVNFGSPQRAAQTIDFNLPASVGTDRGFLVLGGASTAGLPVTFTVVSGPANISGNVLLLSGNTGTVTVRATQPGSDSFNPATEVIRSLAVLPAARVANLSTRAQVRADDASRTVIAGFVIEGLGETVVLIRAVGPGLAQFGIANAAATPRLQLFDHTGKMVAENSGWSGANEVAQVGDQVGAFKLAAGSGDAAVVARLQPGAYTAQVAGATGSVLIEIYDAASGEQLSNQQLSNISTRGFVDTGDGVLIGGFVVTGGAPKRFLIRGIGPALANFNVAQPLADPMLKLFRGSTLVAQNDNWATSEAGGEATTTSSAEIAAAGATAGAFPLSIDGNDAALVVTLEPGSYSVVLSGAGNASGVGLVEIYQARER